MKTVFDNAQTIHVWAAQSQPEGRNSGSTLWFDGAGLYSYRTPIALILPDVYGESVALISSVTYSSTTAQQMPNARDVAPRPCFRVPYLPGLRGGRYVSPDGRDVWDEESRIANIAACHAGNLAHLVADADRGIASAVKMARRTGRPAHYWNGEVHGRDWNDDSAWVESEWSENMEPARALARDYARRFGLPAPAFAADYGRADIMAACKAWHAKESDPKTQRKRDADRRRREVRQSWLDDVAGPILADAGLDAGRRFDRKAIKRALAGIPCTADGASALRVRLAAQIERAAAHRERMAQEAAARAAERAAELAAQDARAEAAGFTGAEWREMFAAIADAERENRAVDAKADIDPARARWMAGQHVAPMYDLPYDLRDLWKSDGAGGDILRVKPSDPATLESARGAEVPLAHARKVWPHILRTMCEGKEWTGSIRCGAFTISLITPRHMVAGCHRFNRAEMVRVAGLIGEPVDCNAIAATVAEGESV